MEFILSLPRRTILAWLTLSPLFFAPAFALGAKFEWTPATPAELAMTDDSKAPGAPAVILSYEETDNGDSGEILIHMRIKVLKDAGRNVGDFSRIDGEFQARTIHPDGTIVPLVIPTPKRILGIFPGKAQPTVATALADVTVGSIVEYFFRSSSNFYSPIWVLQHNYFAHAAHLSLKPPGYVGAKKLRWIAKLPPGATINRVGDHVTLDLADTAPAPDEDFMPPFASAIYNVRFFYTLESTETFWGLEGLSHKTAWDEFCTPDKNLKAAVLTLIQPSDSDAVKLHKIYLAVQALENTDFTRQRTQKEEERSRIVVAQNASDVWTLQRGNSFQLTYLFVALVRAAGYEATPMAVASRNHTVFDREVLSWSQLDSIIAIVQVDTRRLAFDPGVPRCPFGHLAPWHARVTGITITGKKMSFSSTPYDTSQGSRSERVADLTLDPAGNVSGKITITFKGIAGLPLRLAAILEDEQFVRTEIEKDMQEIVPAGVEVKINSLSALSDPEAPLVATLTVTGKFGVATSRRLLIPAQFFSSTSKRLFVTEGRTTPIAFPDRYATGDQMNLTLLAGLVPETLPTSKSISIPLASNFLSRIQAPLDKRNTLITQRNFSLDRLDYTVEEYTALHNYFSQIAGIDQEQISLLTAAAHVTQLGSH